MAIRCGDCLHVMSRCMEENSVDAVVTDPPYNLITLSRNGSPRQPGTGPFGRHREGNVGGFMGKHWDGTGIAFDVETWATVLRILKPSHYLLTFGGTRTWHRLACAIEDAGFEIRDTLMWLYGSGFPKGTACLKPSWEPIILARKPGPKRALGIEECRIATDERLQGSTVRNDMRGGHYGAGHRPATDVPMYEQSPLGRYPANLILNEEAARLLDEQTRTSSPGGASRFFYCAKASRAERNAGMGDSPEKPLYWSSGTQSPGTFQSDGTHKAAQNYHPTVKPLALMRWLIKLVAAEGETVLDPFMGSGTTGVACVMEGRRFLGIEQNEEYVEIAQRRIAHARLNKAAAP